MSGQIKDNLLVLQGGGPTAVVNVSLYGVICQAHKYDRIGRILGAHFGLQGLINNTLTDLGQCSTQMIDNLVRSPGAALGSSRRQLASDEHARLFETLKKNHIRHLLFIGGNGSMMAAHQLSELAKTEGYALNVVGVPKTIDNDIAHTDRCPGYASGARYVAQSVRDIAMDVRSLPVPVSIFETMGRHSGWLAGASSLARTCVDDVDAAPHLIELPERPFDLDDFLGRIDRVVTRLGWAVAVVSEGLRDAQGRDIFTVDDPAHRDEVGRSLPGGVANYLAEQVGRKLKLRCRSEKPGLCGRNSMLHVSPLDRMDAEQVGRAAVDAVMTGHAGTMVTLLATEARTGLVSLAQVAGEARQVPRDWIDAQNAWVARPFYDYVHRLIGPTLLEYVNFIQLERHANLSVVSE